jgi:hypothetical protein
MLALWVLVLLGVAALGDLVDALMIDGCPELFEIAIAQAGLAGEGGDGVDPALLETISAHCFPPRAT